jgi:hypothetical protein
MSAVNLWTKQLGPNPNTKMNRKKWNVRLKDTVIVAVQVAVGESGLTIVGLKQDVVPANVVTHRVVDGTHIIETKDSGPMKVLATEERTIIRSLPSKVVHIMNDNRKRLMWDLTERDPYSLEEVTVAKKEYKSRLAYQDENRKAYEARVKEHEQFTNIGSAFAGL